jgi:hypothetical protein
MAKASKFVPVEHVVVLLQVRPADEGPCWWPKRDGQYAWASVDPYDPPGYQVGIDSDYRFDSIELWKELQVPVEEWIEHMKEEWLEEFGPIEEDEEQEAEEGHAWEFKVIKTDP